MRRRRPARVKTRESAGTTLVPIPRLPPLVDPKKRGGVSLGRLLETARKRVLMSEGGAADRLRISTSELIDYESGLRTPPGELFNHMCEIYGTTRERMVSDAGIAIEEADGRHTLWLGWAPVELHGAPTRDRLFRIATSFRDLRGLAETAPVTIRDEELRFICLAVDVNDLHLLEHLTDALLLGEHETAELFDRMRHHVAPVKDLNRTSLEVGPA